MNHKTEIILLSDKINTICQNMNFQRPMRIELTANSQRQPCLVIGKVIFRSNNWILTREEKLFKLLAQVFSKLSSDAFCTENFELLKSDSFEYESNQYVDPSTPIIVSTIKFS